MKIKYDLLVESDAIDEKTMLVTVARFPGKGATETTQRSVEVDVSDHIVNFPNATEENRHCAAQATGLHWMLVYGGFIQYEWSDDHTKPSHGHGFRFQFRNPSDLSEHVAHVSENQSSYDTGHPLGALAALFSDRYRGARIEVAQPEFQAMADEPDVPLHHYDGQTVWVRNRVDETIAGTEWGHIGIRHAAMAKAYQHHVAIETGRNRQQFIARSPFHFLSKFLLNHRFDPAENQEQFDFLLARWFERKEVQDASIWVVRNPASAMEEDWLLTVTIELLSGSEKTIIRDVNRFSPEVREKMRTKWRNDLSV